MLQTNSNAKQIKFPKKNEQGQEALEVDGSIVIVGANGAGKARLSVCWYHPK